MQQGYIKTNIFENYFKNWSASNIINLWEGERAKLHLRWEEIDIVMTWVMAPLSFGLLSYDNFYVYFYFFCKRKNLETSFNSFFDTVYYERKDADFSNFSTIHFHQIGIWNNRSAKGIKKLNKLSSHVWYLKFNWKSYWAREMMALIGPSMQYGPR